MVKGISVRYKVAVQKFNSGKDSLHDCKCPSTYITHHEPHASSIDQIQPSILLSAVWHEVRKVPSLWHVMFHCQNELFFFSKSSWSIMIQWLKCVIFNNNYHSFYRCRKSSVASSHISTNWTMKGKVIFDNNGTYSVRILLAKQCREGNKSTVISRKFVKISVGNINLRSPKKERIKQWTMFYD